MAAKVRTSLPLHRTEHNKDDKWYSWGTITKTDSKGNTIRFRRGMGQTTGRWVIVKKAPTGKAPTKKPIKYIKGGKVVGTSSYKQGEGKLGVSERFKRDK
jgi:hypothetical protein